MNLTLTMKGHRLLIAALSSAAIALVNIVLPSPSEAAGCKTTACTFYGLGGVPHKGKCGGTTVCSCSGQSQSACNAPV
jgi:hypothetical protein